ncbi:SH3 domain-containing protein [Streptomyces sp. NBC_01498]|uniref:SH3 domain-containing protein n=1 Tax=Streptomyces sp. NBC_01498 TaxID=2975870 RepID=UPI002E7B3F4E|nr:SH3 domain-containing protein [Streptomyces sp. NBC_01498]WTL27680.1 SH3 domain-containing protein [Streptomyces sp. NBC_01498]
MSAPHTGHRIVSVLAGVLLAGTALAAPAVATDHRTGSAPSSAEAAQSPAAVVFKGRVIAQPSLNVRKDPNTSRPPVGSIPFGTVIELECKTNGEVVEGNRRWYKLPGERHWVAARWVENIGAAPGECP